MSDSGSKSSEAWTAWGEDSPPWRGLRMLSKDRLWEFDGEDWRLLAEGEEACERFNRGQ